MNELFEKTEPIDIYQVVLRKNPKLAHRIPQFMFRWLHKFICLDEINKFISLYGHHHGVEFATDFIHFLNIQLHVKGIENIPSPDGRYIFVANHPLGGPDGIALISILGRYFPHLQFPVNDLLMNIKNLNDIFLPINKHGFQSREGALAIEKAYLSNAQIIMFPAGLCSRRINKKIVDLPWQKNFISEAIRHHRQIIPIHIDCQNSSFFYKLANFRKHIGLKFNVEMLWLPRETMQKRNSQLTITFKEAISWKNFDPTKNKKQYAAEIRDCIYN